MLLGSMLAQHHESPSRVSLTLLVTTEIEGREAVVADSQLLGGRVCGRLQDGDTVVLLNVLSANSPIQRPVLISPVLYPSTRICGATQRNQTRAMLPSKFKNKRARSSIPELNTNARLTFNMCSSVVLPALSRPRNRSLACLLRRPSEARIS
jgi:hypothetical protein